VHFSTLFFDLDDTLYPSNTGLWEAIRDRMALYMSERLNIPWEEIHPLRKQYLETYGTTLRGLQHFYPVDTDDYLAFVHDLALDQYLQPDPEIRELILSLPQPRWIFTNSDDAHARRVLNVLNLNNCFNGIIDLRLLNFHCKPEKESYLKALQIAREDNPSRCLILDDSPHNLAAAHELGYKTVLVNPHQQDPAADYHIDSLIDLCRVLPELWEKEDRS
jgi:putative hydrolase of the HAD superfamily